MEKNKNVLKKIVSDEISSFIILGLVTIAVIFTIVVGGVFKDETTQVSSTPLNEQQENNVESVEDLTSVSEVNSIEELQKINENEIKESEKKNKDTKKTSNDVSTPKYYIKVNYGAQVVTIYTKDTNGKYTKPVKAMVCSTGTYTPTSGVYKIPAKIRWCHMIGDVWGQYCTQVVGDILFHSVPYTIKGDHSSLMYNKYDQLGTKASLGCIRLTCEDAKWIYDNCKLGTQVEFYSSSNPGPLGKPTARKISSAPENIRGWDPTDPAKGNPWGEYLKSLENEKKNENTNKVDTNVIENVTTENTIENTIQNTTTENTVENVIQNELVNNTVEIPEINDIIEDDVVNSEIEITNTEVDIVNDTIANTEVNSLL